MEHLVGKRVAFTSALFPFCQIERSFRHSHGYFGIPCPKVRSSFRDQVFNNMCLFILAECLGTPPGKSTEVCRKFAQDFKTRFSITCVCSFLRSAWGRHQENPLRCARSALKISRPGCQQHEIGYGRIRYDKIMSSRAKQKQSRKRERERLPTLSNQK